MQVCFNWPVTVKVRVLLLCRMMAFRFVENPWSTFVSALAALPVIRLLWRLMCLLVFFNQPPLAENISDVFPVPSCTRVKTVPPFTLLSVSLVVCSFVFEHQPKY